VRTLIETSGATALAEIDPEPFTDFATVRPHVRLDAQRHRSIVWPTVGVWSASLPGTDVLLVLGPEPALRWRTFCEQLVGIAERFAGAAGLTLGALLADVPHTRPVQIIGTATDARSSTGSISSAPATKAPRASSGCSSTRSPRTVCRRPRCGPPCPGTPRRSRRRAPRMVARPGVLDDGHACAGGRAREQIAEYDARSSADRRRRRPRHLREPARIDPRRHRAATMDDSRTTTSTTARGRSDATTSTTIPSALADEVEQFLRSARRPSADRPAAPVSPPARSASAPGRSGSGTPHPDRGERHRAPP
jgi:hypothetical protein